MRLGGSLKSCAVLRLLQASCKASMSCARFEEYVHKIG